jgi:signal transduction histidine kinase
MTAAHLVMMRDEGERISKPVGRIMNSGRRMARMIDQLLDFTRVRVGSGVLVVRARADLATIARESVEELAGAHPDAIVRVSGAGDTSGRWDADRLSQVLSNLVGNAVLHGEPAAGVDVKVDGTGERVVVSVRNGGAIPPAVIPHLFEPMTGGGHRRDKAQGLGLGLFISRELVRAHGGTIAVESTDAAGTTMTISLPRA